MAEAMASGRKGLKTMAYIYQADVWCDDCGRAIIDDLTAQGKAPEDPEDESSFDSDEFPKYYDAENDEGDGPQNCADGKCAGEYGTFLRNTLTGDGYAYLKNMLDDHDETLPEHAQEWADYYQFAYVSADDVAGDPDESCEPGWYSDEMTTN